MGIRACEVLPQYGIGPHAVTSRSAVGLLVLSSYRACCFRDFLQPYGGRGKIRREVRQRTPIVLSKQVLSRFEYLARTPYTYWTGSDPGVFFFNYLTPVLFSSGFSFCQPPTEKVLVLMGPHLFRRWGWALVCWLSFYLQSCNTKEEPGGSPLYSACIFYLYITPLLFVCY